MKIIEFKPKYAQEIYDFVMDIKANELGWEKDAVDLHDIPNIYLKNSGNFWIATDKDKIVGTIALKDMNDHQGYLKRMYVSSEYRGTGLAQNMLQILLDHAKNHGFEEIYLATTFGEKIKRAIAFYEKSGFKRVPSLPENFSDDDDTHFYRLEIK